MKKTPKVWTIDSTDFYLDLETFKHFNVELCSSIIPTKIQEPDAIKIGGKETLKSHAKIFDFLHDYSGFSVLDLNDPEHLSIEYPKPNLNHLKPLFPYLDLIVLNGTTAEKILGLELKTDSDIKRAANFFIENGAKSIFLKKLYAQYWTNGQESFWLSQKPLPHNHESETNCVLSAAITACFALGHSLKDAIIIASMYVQRGCHQMNRNRTFIHGPWPENQIFLPSLSTQALHREHQAFNAYTTGLYPIIDRSHWLEKLLPLGVKTVQLRIKDLEGQALQNEIKRSVALAKKYTAKLFINDYWALAIQYHADGVHLGQEDLLSANIDEIRESGLLLGISTHCYYEVAAAHTFRPSYIACGPIYETTSKIMPFKPQGLEQLQRWRRTLDYPLVAIGGINLERLPDVLGTGVQGISLISAITKAPNPEQVTQKFQQIISEHSYAS